MFTTGQDVFIENKYWSVAAQVAKVTEKAVQFSTTDNEDNQVRTAWFPKKALKFRPGEEGRTVQIEKWFRGDNFTARFFNEA